MDGFKDSTRTVRFGGGSACRGAAKVSKVMHAFKNGGVVDRNMLESTSARPTVSPPRATPREVAAVARGNRNQRLEMGDEGVLPARMRRGVPVASKEPLIKRARGGLSCLCDKE